MNNITITQTSTNLYRYTFSVINIEDEDIQNLTAYFLNPPSDSDWSDWLGGWASCGYFLFSKPVLAPNS